MSEVDAHTSSCVLEIKRPYKPSVYTSANGVCVYASNQPDTNPKPATKQYTIVSIELHIVVCPTYLDKFIRCCFYHFLLSLSHCLWLRCQILMLLVKKRHMWNVGFTSSSGKLSSCIQCEGVRRRCTRLQCTVTWTSLMRWSVQALRLTSSTRRWCRCDN